MKLFSKVASVVSALLLMGIFYVTPCLAAPANRFPIEVTQPDGTQLMIQVHGDEYFNWTTRVDNEYVIERDSDGVWKYVTSNDVLETKLETGAELLPPAGAITVDELRLLKPELSRPIDDDYLPVDLAISADGYRKPENLMVLLVSFDNVKITTPKSYWENIFFGDAGSVNSFYMNNSNGNFKFLPATGDISTSVRQVTLPMDHPYTESVLDLSDGSIVHIPSEALKQLDKDFDFKSYDVNNNGIIDENECHFYFIVAGYEDSYGSGNRPGVWGHRWKTKLIDTEKITLRLDNVEFMSYVMNGEYFNDNILATIGIACHELGHSLGAPDLYNTVYSSNVSPGMLSVMDSGSWGYAEGEVIGSSPTYFDPWNRIFLNFAKPETVEDIEGLEKIFTPASNPAYNFIKIPIKDAPKQYFLVEYRDFNGQDRGMQIGFKSREGGVVFWHIDEAVIEKLFQRNTINNNDNRMGIMWIPLIGSNPFFDKGSLLSDLHSTYFLNQDDILDYTRTESNINALIDKDNPNKVNFGSDLTNVKTLACIDYPLENGTYHDSLTISGWALHTEDGLRDAIDRIELYIDDYFICDMERYYREDLKDAVPGFTDYLNAGYKVTLDISTLPADFYTITVRVIDKGDNTVSEQSRHIEILPSGKKPPLFHIDSPSKGQSITENFKVTGWALATNNGIDNDIYEILFSVDDVLVPGYTDYYYRPDVEQAILGYGDYSKCGFSKEIRIDGLTYGEHEVAMIIFDSVGQLLTYDTFMIDVQPNAVRPMLVHIDSPGEAEILKDQLIVSGWALFSTDGINDDIKGIAVLIDDVRQGEVIRMYRHDVEELIKDYGDYTNCGFVKEIDISALSNGSHTVTVIVWSKDGTKLVTSSREFIVNR